MCRHVNFFDMICENISSPLSAHARPCEVLSLSLHRGIDISQCRMCGYCLDISRVLFSKVNPTYLYYLKQNDKCLATRHLLSALFGLKNYVIVHYILKIYSMIR